MIQELQDFGLSEKEAKVYYASLEIGKATADQLAKQAKINRSTTYVQIESLKKKGLMSEFFEGKKTFFVAESPEYLQRLFEKQRQDIDFKEKELNRILPDLQGLFGKSDERPIVRFFEGKAGVSAMRAQVLQTKEKEILVLYSHDALAAAFSLEERKIYSDKRIQKKISARMIYNSSDGPFGSQRELSIQKFVESNKLKINNDIVIFDDCVGITSFGPKPVGALIQNKSFAESFRSIFEFIWQQL